MPRAFFPHSLGDVIRAVDGPLGLIVGDMPDGAIWVLKRHRKEPGYQLSHHPDATRRVTLSSEVLLDRKEAINRFAAAIQLGEAL